MNQNPTHQDVTNMLRDQWPASIEVGDANKEARGKAVMMGPGAMKDMKERSLKNKGKGAENRKHFRDGEDSTLVFFHLVVRGATKQGGKILNDLGVWTQYVN